MPTGSRNIWAAASKEDCTIQNRTKHLTRAALFAALMALCAWTALPIGDIAFTMQTFGVLLTLLVLGGKWGTVSILIYLLLGAAGMPVFSGFQGGIGALAGVTGGYLWGFLFSGLFYWAAEGFHKQAAAVGALAVCYLCGTLWFRLYARGGLGFILLRCVAPYLIPDAIKLVLAFRLSRRLSKIA